MFISSAIKYEYSLKNKNYGALIKGHVMSALVMQQFITVDKREGSNDEVEAGLVGCKLRAILSLAGINPPVRHSARPLTGGRQRE